ncbi:MAG: hypothetical protein EFT35_00445 [Methanophagales archaeon ANME-1-THS]|nr:MAG: hypothetical protein EFT35_00445 [Methanophagales archaeon ANME-1-THS]
MERRTIVALLATSFFLVAMVAEIPALAQPTGPTADIRIDDATGTPGTFVEVPVIITNVANGPVQGIRLRIDCEKRVLNLTSISNGDLTRAPTWITRLGTDTMVIATNDTGAALQNGRSGSVVLLTFKVSGSPGKTSRMNMTLIELANPDGVLGNASAKNGTFTVISPPATTPPPYTGGGGGGYFVPPTTPTPKATLGAEEETELEAPSSSTHTPESTSSESPAEAPSPKPGTVLRTPPLFVLLIGIGVIVAAGMLIVIVRRRKAP